MSLSFLSLLFSSYNVCSLDRSSKNYWLWTEDDFLIAYHISRWLLIRFDKYQWEFGTQRFSYSWERFTLSTTYSHVLYALNWLTAESSLLSISYSTPLILAYELLSLYSIGTICSAISWILTLVFPVSLSSVLPLSTPMTCLHSFQSAFRKVTCTCWFIFPWISFVNGKTSSVRSVLRAITRCALLLFLTRILSALSSSSASILTSYSNWISAVNPLIPGPIIAYDWHILEGLWYRFEYDAGLGAVSYVEKAWRKIKYWMSGT